MARRTRLSPLLSSYRSWLLGCRGLTESTWELYRPTASRFVREVGPSFPSTGKCRLGVHLASDWGTEALCDEEHSRRRSFFPALPATKDLHKVALWLGHESVETTEISTRAAPEEKFDVLNSLLPYGMKPGRFAPAMKSFRSSTPRYVATAFSCLVVAPRPSPHNGARHITREGGPPCLGRRLQKADLGEGILIS